MLSYRGTDMDRLEFYRCNVPRPSGDVPVGDAANLRGISAKTAVSNVFDRDTIPELVNTTNICTYKDNSPTSNTFVKAQNIPAQGVYCKTGSTQQFYPSHVILEETFGHNDVMETCYIEDGMVIIC